MGNGLNRSRVRNFGMLRGRSRRAGLALVVCTALGMLATVAVGPVPGTATASAASAAFSTCRYVTTADVEGAFGGQVGPGDNQPYSAKNGGGADCVFNLGGANNLAAAMQEAVSGQVIVYAVPASASTIAQAVSEYQKLLKNASSDCTMTSKQDCPLPGIGDAAYFAGLHAGGGGSGLLIMLAGGVAFFIDSGNTIVNTGQAHWANAYAANRTDLIALARAIAAPLSTSATTTTTTSVKAPGRPPTCRRRPATTRSRSAGPPPRATAGPPSSTTSSLGPRRAWKDMHTLLTRRRPRIPSRTC